MADRDPWAPVLEFWFGEPPEIRSDLWFRGARDTDDVVTARFGALTEQALSGLV